MPKQCLKHLGKCAATSFPRDSCRVLPAPWVGVGPWARREGRRGGHPLEKQGRPRTWPGPSLPCTCPPWPTPPLPSPSPPPHSLLCFLPLPTQPWELGINPLLGGMAARARWGLADGNLQGESQELGRLLLERQRGFTVRAAAAERRPSAGPRDRGWDARSGASLPPHFSVAAQTPLLAIPRTRACGAHKELSQKPRPPLPG